MEETQSMKLEGFIGYRLENNIYYLVDFSTDEILSQMEEVSILYDGNVLLKHGRFKLLKPKFDKLRKIYGKANIEHDLNLITGKFQVEELDKILSISDYIGLFVKKNRLKVLFYNLQKEK